MKVLFIAWLTFHEARRRKTLWAGLGLGVVFLILFGVGFHFLYRDLTRAGDSRGLREMSNFFSMAGLYAVNFLVVMVSVLTPVDTVSGEVVSHSIQSIVTKPLRRWEVILGKWLGFGVMIVAYVLLMAGGVILVSWAIGGYAPPNPLEGVALMMLKGLILLSVTLLGGACFSTLTNGVLVFMLFGLAFIGGWVEQLGALVRNEAAIRVGIISSLIMPSEALWHRAAYLMQPRIFQDLVMTPFAVASVPSLAMVVYSLLYGLAALGGAAYVFQRRDL